VKPVHGESDTGLAVAGYTIRTAEPRDLPGAVASICRVLYEDLGYAYRSDWQYDLDDAQRLYLDDRRHTLFVATDNATGRIIGTTGVQATGPKSPPHPSWLAERYVSGSTAQLFRVYVQREHRRRGLARALVENARHFIAQTPGYECLYLHTDADASPGAEAFWRSLDTVEVYDARGRGELSRALHFEMTIPGRASVKRLASMQNTGHNDAIDWWGWRNLWAVQQTTYMPFWEERFSVMLDAVADVLGEPGLVIDLCCGLGSLAERVLARFPSTHVVAVDVDPVLLAIGRSTLGDASGRLRWVNADLTDPRWADELDVSVADAVLSTTALHWLPAADLVRLYQQLAQLIRPGGIFENGDHMNPPPRLSTVRRLFDTTADRWYASGMTTSGGEDWTAWWQRIEAHPGMAELLSERAERSTQARSPDQVAAQQRLQEAALEGAGFAEVSTIWQHLQNRVLLAVR
jgi:SAM-dependent methyltransferase/ribosomal protein S18 acetylase RimI-like enzyme